MNLTQKNSSQNSETHIFSQLRILILEDVPRDADLIVRELRRAGLDCEVRITDTREGMFRELEDFSPDLILSDYTMPQFSGMDALDIRNKRSPFLPFVIVTSSINEETAVDCIKRGADDYVLKQNLVRLPHVTKNVLEKKRLEQVEIKSREQMLQAARQWRTSFDAIREGVALLDANQKILRCNAAMQKRIGKPLEQIIGQYCCRDIHGFSNSPLECPVQRTIRTLKRETWETRVGDRFFDFIADPVLDEEGKLSGIVHIVADITERKRLESKKIELETQLHQAQKLEAVGRLAGGVAHDYNNMLSVILGFSELAMEKIPPGSELHDDLREIHSAAARSRDITRQLLAFARREAICPADLDLNIAMQGMLKMLQRLVGEDIDLTWLPGSELWKVWIDPSQLDQILANLCVNARDAIGNIGKLIIKTSNVVLDETYCDKHAEFKPGDYVKLEVSDNGCGMSRETIDKIFEPFFTTKGPGKGTGLGLSTVYGIVKRNQGLINVYSEPGKGTTFKIFFPRYTGAAVEKKIVDTVETLKGNCELLLVVEDDPSILKLTGTILTGLGYCVLSAGTPTEALHLAEQHAGSIHLLLTDMVMPEMNGWELAEQLQTFSPSLKRLFMSGYATDVIADRGMLQDNFTFIQKPFSAKTLAARVREVLGQAIPPTK